MCVVPILIGSSMIQIYIYSDTKPSYRGNECDIASSVCTVNFRFSLVIKYVSKYRLIYNLCILFEIYPFHSK